MANRPFSSLTHSMRTVWISLTLPGLVADEFFGADEILPRVGAEEGGGFLLAVIELVDLGPLRPGIVGGAFQRRLGQNLELHQASAAVPHRGADAIGAGVAAADDDHVLSLGGDVIGRRRDRESSRLLVLAVRNSMAKWIPLSSRPGTLQIARLGGAAAQDDGVELLEELRSRNS